MTFILLRYKPMSIISADYFCSLDFTKVQSPSSSEDSSPYRVPNEVPCSELDEVAIAFVKGLPSPLLDFVGQSIPAKQIVGTNFKYLTEYQIEPVFNTGIYLIRKYTFYQ